MSRIGNSPVTIPSGVDVSVSGSVVSVKGPKGSLDHTAPSGISVSTEDASVILARQDDTPQQKSLHGLTRSLVNNMVLGVSEGFKKDLEIIGVGYRAKLQGSKIELALGFSHPVVVEAPEGISFEVPEPTKISVLGVDKQVVGEVAAKIRAHRPPEPYKGKGVRYVGEHVVRKAGKAGK